VWVVWWCNG